MNTFTHDEINLMCIYNTGTRQGLIDELTTMRGYLADGEKRLKSLTNSTLKKLVAISDAEYAEMELCPDFDE